MSHLALPEVGTLDDLLERARRGVEAGNALDLVRGTLAQIRDEHYRRLLSAPDDRLSEIRGVLRGIEALADRLLTEQAHGDAAYQSIQQQFGPGGEQPTPVLAVSAVPKRRRRVSATTA